MRNSICLISITGLFFVIACKDAKRLSDANFTQAINDYLTKHGEICTVIDRQFPIDLPRPAQSEQYGIGPKLAALEQVGLMQATETEAVAHGLLDPLRGSTPSQSVKRYELTESGRRYLQKVPGAFGQTNGFCYGQKSVDTIVKWTEPAMVGASSQTEVTYTYRIVDPAPWAERVEVQQAFSDIRATVHGASKTTEVVGLQLTSKGWEVPGQ